MIMKTKTTMQIAIIDDDPLFTRVMQKNIENVLGDLHPVIKTYQVGELFLDKLDTENPEIIFLDVNLNSKYGEAMGGFRVLDQIKKQKPNSKVIMISGQSHLRNELDTIKRGAHCYVAKDDLMYNTVNLELLNSGQTYEIRQGYSEFKRIIQVGLFATLALGLLGYLFLTLQ